MHYFAYGVNMNLDGMKTRSPEAEFMGAARLEEHELIFDGQSIRRPGATANIREKEGAVVWGGLFQINEQTLAELDAFENFPISYLRKAVTVTDEAGATYEAVVYYREGEVIGRPGESYLADVVQGAKDCMLPATYITELESLETV